MSGALKNRSEIRKVTHVYLDNHSFGGVQKMLLQTLPGLAERGDLQVELIATKNSQLHQQAMAMRLPCQGISFPLKKQSLIRSLLCKPLFRTLDFTAHYQVLRLLRQSKPDLVHVHGGRIEHALIRQAGFPVVYTYHGYGHLFNIEAARKNWEKTYYRLMRPVFQGVTPFLNGMAIVSEYERQRLYRERFIPESLPTEVIYNGLDMAALQAYDSADQKRLRRQFGLPENTRIVGFISRLAVNRNPLALLRIAEAVLRSEELKNPVYFVVAGDGLLAPRFKEAFESHPLLSRHGRYLGFVENVHDLITAVDLTMNTTLVEGFGLGALESIGLGRPCIAYKTGAIPEILSLPEAHPWLVPTQDEDAYVQALIHLLNQPQAVFDHLSHQLKAHARRFDLSQTVDAYLRFYHRLA